MKKIDLIVIALVICCINVHSSTSVEGLYMKALKSKGENFKKASGLGLKKATQNLRDLG